jgi:protein-S-isoprenylcysteine O-methyltransferase Ste14
LLAVGGRSLAQTFSKKMLQVLSGVGGFVGGVILLNKQGAHYNFERPLEAAIIAYSAFIPMLIVEALHTNYVGTNKEIPFKEAIAIFGVRSVGLAITMLVIMTGYWCINDYHASFMSGVFGIDTRGLDGAKPFDENNVPYYHNFFRVFGVFFQIVCRGSMLRLGSMLIVTLGVSQLLKENPVDGFYAAGQAVLAPMLILLQSSETATEVAETAVANICAVSDVRFALTPSDLRVTLRNHALEYVVRAFFGPLMFCSICDNLPRLHYHGFHNFMSFFEYTQNLIFTADLTFACVGYLSPFSFSSLEPTVLGWISALLCYNPMYSLMHDRYFDYLSNKPWNEWFDAMNNNQNASEFLSFRVWGCSILFLQLIFAMCTASYGLRYANLSYRVVITSGPYYFLRHPAYVVKILSFAMIHVPFVDVSTLANAMKQLTHVQQQCAAAVGTKATEVCAGTLAAATAATRSAYFNGPAIRRCVALACFAGVYVLRAATEEAHLTVASEGLYERYKQNMAARWRLG